MRYYILESGSKGNSTLIFSKGKYLLIDNGLSERKFRSYLNEINVSLSNINVVLVTHSHSDHTAGLKIFESRCIYATKSTTTLLDRDHELVPYRSYNLNGFKITVVPTSHDAVGSVGFIIEDSDNEKLVYITDTGYIYERVLSYIKDADYYIFEANHDVRMQLTSGRPQYLIDRIMGDYGHLSNEDSAICLSEVITNRTKEIVLAHLSEEANTPELALNTFYKIMAKRRVDVSHISVRCAKQREMVCGGTLTEEIFNG